MNETEREPVWLENVGEILPYEDGEFFWVLPKESIDRYKCYVSSPCFTFDQENWHLVMIGDGRRTSYFTNTWVSLYLWTKSCNVLKPVYNVRLSLKTVDDEDVGCCSGETFGDYGFGHFRFLNRQEIRRNVFCFGRLKIFCVIKRKEDNPVDLDLSSDKKKSLTESEISEICNFIQSNEIESKGVDRLLENFEQLLDNEYGSDVVLKTNDHEFRAHTVVLGARSPVFAAMFHHDMKEKNTGEVDISDCSTAGFEVFLHFLYTGEADDMSLANVTDLYYIAEKYQANDLKTDCVEYMKRNLSAESFCDVITLSLKHSESDLQNAAIRFFQNNIKKIVKTVQWQKYLTEYPTHANELIIKALNA